MMRLAAFLPLVFASSAIADQARLSWDHPGADGYRVYQDGAQVADVTEKTAEITLPQAGATYAVSAYRGGVESAKSDPLIVPAAPTNFSITITFGGP